MERPTLLSILPKFLPWRATFLLQYIDTLMFQRVNDLVVEFLFCEDSRDLLLCWKHSLSLDLLARRHVAHDEHPAVNEKEAVRIKWNENKMQEKSKISFQFGGLIMSAPYTRKCTRTERHRKLVDATVNFFTQKVIVIYADTDRSRPFFKLFSTNQGTQRWLIKIEGQKYWLHHFDWLWFALHLL